MYEGQEDAVEAVAEAKIELSKRTYRAKKDPLPYDPAFECSNCAAHEGLTVKLKPCSRCKLVRYCSVECQRQHWRAGEHRRFCVAVGDRVPQELAPKRLNATADKDDCPVCMEPLTSAKKTILACGHVLHLKCLKDILALTKSQLCPVCRGELLG